MKKISRRVGILLLFFLSLLLFRTAWSAAPEDLKTVIPFSIDESDAAHRLAAALRFPTISPQDNEDFQPKPFEDFRDWLHGSYPLTYAQLEVEVIDQSFFLHWKGKTEAKPVLLMSHLDVVPVEPGTESEWTFPAFDGTVADGHVWGRGALDVKSGVTAWHEAIEHLLAGGFQPVQDLYFAFGQDEEVGGLRGNKIMADVLQQRGVHFEMVVDEGGFILQGLYPELEGKPVAVIAVAEKAYFTLKLESTGIGGHSSTPPEHTSVGKMATAMHRLENDPFPTELCAPMRQHLEALAPYMPFWKRFVFENLWLTKPMVLWQMAQSPKSNAMARTTTAVTLFHGGIKDNVVPQKASGQVNFRLLPGQSFQSVRDHVQHHTEGLDITVSDGLLSHPPQPGRTDSRGWKILQRSIQEVIPQVVVTPFLLTGATDSRHYAAITDDIYRFIGIQIPLDDFTGVHGTDERVGIHAYADAIRVNIRFLKNLSL